MSSKTDNLRGWKEWIAEQWRKRKQSATEHHAESEKEWQDQVEYRQQREADLYEGIAKRLRPDEQETELIRLIREEQKSGSVGSEQRIKLLQNAKSRKFLGSDWGKGAFQAYLESAEAHGRESPESIAAYTKYIKTQDNVQHAFLAAPPKSIEEKEHGILGTLLSPFLTGERSSGTVIYGIRKRLFGEIPWIEEREKGERFKEISPSQALGLATADTKFWTPRGVISLAVDIRLDPLSYVGIGLLGKAGKIPRALRISSQVDEGITKVVGPKGIEFIQNAINNGATRKEADERLLEIINNGADGYLAAKKYAESSAHIFGRVLFYTAPYEKAALKAWELLPYAQKRAKGVDMLQTAFVPFHKAVQEVGEAVKEPFLKFYRQTAYQTSRARAEIRKISKQTPKEFTEDVVTQLEIKRLFRKPQEELAAREATKASGEPVSTGMEAAGKESDAILQAAEDTIARRKLATDEFNQHKAQLLEAAKAEEYATAASEAARKAQNRANIIGTPKTQKTADEALTLATDLTNEATALRKAVGPAPPPKTKPQLLADAEALAEESRTIDQIRENAQLDAGSVLANARNAESGAVTTAKDTVATRPEDPFDTQSIGESAASRAIAALDPEATPPPTAVVTAADELRAIYDTAFKEKVDLGIAQEGSYRQGYMHHVPGKEGEKWLKKTHDGTNIPRKHGPLQQRKYEGSVYEANEWMYLQTGITHFFVEDPYIATQMYIAKHNRQVQSHLLHQKILKDYGRDTGLPTGLAPETTKIGGMKYTLYKHSGKETYLPTAVHKELTRTQPHHSWRTDTYEPTLGTLKKSWLAMWPGYYSRNLYGGVGWQNLLAGVEPTDYVRNTDVLYGDPNKIYDIPLYGKKTGKELKELMEYHNVLGQLGYVSEPSTIGPLSPLGRLYQAYPEAAMKLSENQLRGPVFMHYLYKTGDPEYAAEMVYKHHFEYLKGTYTAFEEEVLFNIVPFGRWQRGNIPLQTEMMFRKPGLFAAQARLQDMGSTPEEYNEMPDWQKEKLTYVHKGNVYAYDMPMMDLRAMLDPAAMYGMTTPFLQYGVSEIRGKTKYGKDMDPWRTGKGAEQQAELAATTFEGRYYYFGRELIKTGEGERPVSATAIHQLGGVGVHKAPPPPKPVSMQAFKAERWHESGAHAAWLAAGGTEEAPEDTGEPIKIDSGRRREKAKVIRVIDGDTIEVELYGRLQTVRYIGMDTPETHHPHKPIGLGGFEASAANRRLVKGKTVYMEKDRTNKDKYGRLLRNVFLEDNTFVNAELVRLGYAKEKYYRPDKRYKPLLEELEADAPKIKAVLPWGGYPSLEEQEQAVWVAAGSPEGFHIKTLSDGSKLALTHEAYKASTGFKPTEEQLQYIFTGRKTTLPKLSPFESPAQTMLRVGYKHPGANEARYNELVAEWQAYRSGEMHLEQPTPEQKQASWERAGLEPGDPYKHKVYRDDSGKLLGVATYTPEELEAMGSWKPTTEMAEWAFRKTARITPEEELAKFEELERDIGFRPSKAQMEWATRSGDVGELLTLAEYNAEMEQRARASKGEYYHDAAERVAAEGEGFRPVRFDPDEQIAIFAREYEAQLHSEEDLREELHSLRGVIASKEQYVPQQTGSTGERFKRRQELEEMLGTGVDR